MEGYFERHHILPRCMGGSDDASNIVLLTPEEHFTAHVLLVKMHPEIHGLIKAVNKMCQGTQRSNNRMYGWLKRKFSEEMSRTQRGESNSQFGTMWITRQSGESKKVPVGSILDEGWYRGRNGKPTIVRKKVVRTVCRETCIRCNSKIDNPTKYRTLCKECFIQKQAMNSHKQKGYKAQV